LTDKDFGIDIKSFKDGEGFFLLAIKYEGKWCTFLLTFKDLDGFIELGNLSEKLIEYLEREDGGK